LSDSLGGASVALLEARMESELAALVRRHGGEPVCVPALREVERDCAAEASHAADAISAGGAVVALATGVALERWLRVAESLGRGAEVREGLARSTVVCRGPKPVAVLKREGLPVHVRAEAPHTTADLVAALLTVEVQGRAAVVVQDGGASPAVPEALAARGARVIEVRPYAWAPPEDPAPLRALVRRIADGGVEALAITTQAQARYLFDAAREIGLADAMAAALRGRVVLAAVGPTCARALEALGVPPRVTPAQPRMGPMVVALAAALTAAR
jgi:uroporphyrinogen-III synthase